MQSMEFDLHKLQSAVRTDMRAALREVAKESPPLSRPVARYFVDLYYQLQALRIGSAHQARENEPHSFAALMAREMCVLEDMCATELGRFSESTPTGQWARSIYGIGPVITAGLLAHIDFWRGWRQRGCNCSSQLPEEQQAKMRKARKLKKLDPMCAGHPIPTAGQIWSFAGLHPRIEWEKGQRRPYNAKLKRLCWNIGQSFMRFSGSEKCWYGQQYRIRKEYEVARNEAGGCADAAAEKLKKFRIGKDTVAYSHYSEGRLPPAHVDARARRWVVKLFLSHLHAAWSELERGEKAPEPYAIAHLGHAHLLDWRSVS